MMWKRWILIVVLLVILVQVASYTLLSGNKVHADIIGNQDFYILDTDLDSLSFVFSLVSENQHAPYGLTRKEESIYRDRYDKEVNYIEIHDKFDSISGLLKRDHFVTCVLQFDFSWMHFSLEEYVERIDSNEPYVEIWESEYIWVLFRWVKIRRENKGIS